MGVLFVMIASCSKTSPEDSSSPKPISPAPVVTIPTKIVYPTNTLDSISNPVLEPMRRIIPSMGGLDISPVITIIILGAARRSLVPWLFAHLNAIIG